MACLLCCCQMVFATDKLDDTGVMTFTALHRDKWAEVREDCFPDPLK